MINFGIQPAVGNLPPVLLKDSYFEQWKDQLIEFIENRENGEDMMKSFTEGPIRIPYDKLEKDYTSEEIKRIKADKEAGSNLYYALPSHGRKYFGDYKANSFLMWNMFTKKMFGSAIPFKRKTTEDKEKNLSENKSECLKDKVDELTNNISIMEQGLRKERVEHLHDQEKAESENLKDKIAELTKKLSTMDEELRKERTEHLHDQEEAKKEILSLSKKVSELETAANVEKKENKERKALELKCIKLSKQNSDFEKVLFLEKERIEKERAEFESKRKVFESKNGELSLKITELEKELDVERKELEKKKKADFQAKSFKDDHSYAKKILQQEIQMLKKNLKTLSTDIMKEKKSKSDIQKKLELVTKERHVFSLKVKALKKSQCHPDVSFKGFDSSRNYTKNQIRPSNLFYDPSVDKSSKYHSNDLPTFKKVKMEWKVKGKTPETGKTPEKDATKSYDFVRSERDQFWYGSYYISPNRPPLNTSGPKFRWVPKST